MRQRGRRAASTRRGSSTPLVAATSNSPASEAYRVLRTNLAATGEGADGVILVTSATSGEGKSATCANLAITLAMSGKRVLILDADLRLPSQHLIFRVAPGDYPIRLQRLHASGDRSATDALAAPFTVEVDERLWLLPAGAPIDNPAELLASDVIADLLAELRQAYDVVLVDSPPVGMVTDAAIIAPHADGTLLVLDHGQSQRRLARRAVSALERVNARVLGVVLNKAPTGAGFETTYGYGHTPGA